MSRTMSNRPDGKAINCHIRADQAEALDRLVWEEERTISYFVRKALDQYLGLTPPAKRPAE